MNDELFLGFAVVLGILGTIFVSVYVYRLLKVPEMGKSGRTINLVFLAGAGVFFLVGMGLTFFGSDKASDWGLFLSSATLAVALLWLAAQGFGVGFKQMDEDGIGFLRFFQLGSSIVLCLSLAPAFFAFITFASKLR
jgi:hypothetical protein